MPATASKTAEKAAAAPTGKIAVMWHPEKDSQVPAPPQGSKSDRPFLHSWVADPSEIATRRQLEDAAFNGGKPRQYRAMKTQDISLEPGLNWVDAPLWEGCKNSSNNQQVNRLLDEGALVAMEATAANPSGSITDYGYEDALKIIASLDDLDQLKSLLADEKLRDDVRLQSRLQSQIDTVRLSWGSRR